MWDEAEKFLQKDKYIAPLIQKWGSCTIKPIRKGSYFKDLVDAICSQQLSGKAAKTIFERVKIALRGRIVPERLVEITTEDLRKCGLSYQKCSYVKDLSERIVNCKLRIENLDKLTDDEVVNELVQVKGIGRWTAEMFLMFSLARPDIFPAEDLGIKKAMQKLKLKNSERWRPHRTVASWYLWRSLENR